METRILFGYWHALFSTEPITTGSVVLLNCIIKDPNPRCRVAALQATSTILFGSKAFLTRAECTDKPPTSFMPFSIALGNMILMMYSTITQAIANESSLPVLTQILKCLFVLIQATPFNRLKSGFVNKFVQYIRKLVYHQGIFDNFFFFNVGFLK